MSDRVLGFNIQAGVTSREQLFWQDRVVQLHKQIAKLSLDVFASRDEKYVISDISFDPKRYMPTLFGAYESLCDESLYYVRIDSKHYPSVNIPSYDLDAQLWFDGLRPGIVLKFYSGLCDLVEPKWLKKTISGNYNRGELRLNILKDVLSFASVDKGLTVARR